MRKNKFSRIIILLIIIITFFLPSGAKGAGIEQASLNINEPLITILSETSAFIEIHVRFPENPIFENSNGMIFNENIYSHPSEIGVPDLPVLRKSVKLPFGNDYTLEILNAESRTAQLGEDGLPASIPERAAEVEKSNPLQTDDSTEDVEDEKGDDPLGSTEPDDGDPQEIDQPQDDTEPQETNEPQEGDLVNFEESFPTSPAQLVQTYIMRGHNIGQFQIWPVAYYAGQQTVEIYEEITFRINIQQADANLSAHRATSMASPAFDRLLSSEVLNYNVGIDAQSERTKGNELILVIAPDAFLGTLDALVALKQNQGHPVTLVPLSTTGSTPDSIKAYISNAYHNWTSPPTYVLLVGDVNNGANSMPAFIGLSSESVTDLYYGTVDGNDWIPDVFVGRLPARNTTQLNTMITNLAAYNNLTGTEGWIKKAAFLASNDSNFWHVAEATQDYVISTHTQPAGYTGIFPSSPQSGGDKLYAYSNSAGNADVANAINNQRALISYTGHGSRSSWGGPSYSQSNIRSISHTGVFSVVTSFACITGDFNATESFGETWLLQQNKGAVAFIGSSASSFWGPDDTLERAMMDSLYSGYESANMVSSFLYDGLMAVEATRPGTGTAQSRYYWETYNLLGDPSLEMLIEQKDSDFTISTNPTSLSVCQGSSTDTTVTVGQINGFNNQISLSLSDLPAGVSGSYSQNPILAPATSSLTLSAENSTSIGQYTVKVNGDSGGVHHDFDLALQVFDGSPQSVNLSHPADDSSNISVTPQFNWNETQANQTYEIQVSKDSNFSQLAVSQSGVQTPYYTPTTPLEHNTHYYWRVRAANPCGNSAFSEVFELTTALAPGSCPVGTALSVLYQTQFETYPANWTKSGTNNTWTRTTARALSANYSFYTKNQNMTSLEHLTTPTIELPNTDGSPITLAFWHWFEIEASTNGCFDGALLEISNDGGGTWTPIEDDLLLSSKYAGLISTSYGNPMGGKQAWCGSRDWSEALVDLSAYAGQSIKLRFTHASDASIGLEGWYVDDFSISACEAIPNYRPHFNTPKVSASQAPGREVTVKLELANAGLQPDTYSLNINSNGWVARAKDLETISLAPGEVKIIEITVTIPMDAEPGEINEVFVFATSQNDQEDPAAEDIATIELKSGLLNFIPLLSSP